MDHNAPRRPERPPAQPDAKGGSWLPIALVLLPLGMLVAAVVIFTGRAGLLVLAVVCCVPGFVFLHYLLWGRWLGKSLREAADDEPRQP